MYQPDYAENLSLSERLRARLGRRSIAIIGTLVLEALIVLAIISLGQTSKLFQPKQQVLTTVDIKEPPPDRPVDKPQTEKKETPQKTQEVAPVPAPTQAAPPVEKPAVAAPAFIPLSPKQLEQADISSLPKATPAKPGAPAYGPAFTGNSLDSKRVGTAPDGKPLYAATWYREPTQQELAGYLSTAQGPAWGLIACKTVPEYRVEKCVGLDETDHSNMLRAVLAAAWQFRVRPPRLGGRELYGEWVRIRIDYQIRQKPSYDR